jgi:ABC-type nitrate/sulfonate/bicarbonate transport system substrate-binding protein
MKPREGAEMTTYKRTILKRILFTLIVFFGIILPAQAGERVIIGISPSLTATLNIIAKQQGFFSQLGIDADIRVIESGSKAVAMMLNDELDISESAIFALVSNSFIRRDFKIYTQVSISGNDNMIVARKDKGIRKITDLKGKKVGVLKGGFPHYVLDLMLLNAGVDSKKIRLVFEENGRLYQMLSSGELDAVCFYGGWVDKTAKTLKDNAVMFHDEKLVRVTVVHAGKTNTFERRPELFSRILKAYIKAEEYVKKNPDAAMKTVVEYLKLDMLNAQKVWKPKMVDVALQQSLIKDMENLAQWQIDIGMQNNVKFPNYLEFIHFRNLMEVDPKRVTIAH